MLSLSHTQTLCNKNMMGGIVTEIVVNVLLDSEANISLIRSSVIKDRVSIKSTSNIAIKTGKGNLNMNKTVNVIITMPFLKTQLKETTQFLVPDDDVAFNDTNGCLYENSGYIDRKNKLVINAHISQELSNIKKFKKLINDKTWKEIKENGISCSTLVAPIIRFKSIKQSDIRSFKPYSVPYKYRFIIREKMLELLRGKVIKEAASHPLMASVLLIPKSNKNEFRLVKGDFTFFFKNNYYSFTRLPQGAKNSAQIMYYLLVNTFKHDSEILWYADDAIVRTKDTVQEHIQHMVKVVKMLVKYKLRVKISKNDICAQVIESLGHRVNSNRSYSKLKHSDEILKQIKWLKTNETNFRWHIFVPTFCTEFPNKIGSYHQFIVEGY
uniref:Reverse transcriptase domain-containing protein n=1 Tax=Strongyloides venezuelensis TaxID=75913 RepID=A0A0K0FQ58_STRVS